MQIQYDFVSKFWRNVSVKVAMANTHKDTPARSVAKGEILVPGILEDNLLFSGVEVVNMDGSFGHEVPKEFAREFQKANKPLDGLGDVKALTPQESYPYVGIIQIANLVRGGGASCNRCPGLSVIPRR
mmetsp:Transcript_10302/g.25908  ORF Transcript_10302/g.25908 Transcript_10302/m.25908 type:complete len:128 (+) Transcript_10302:825-1208(+)